MHALLKYVNKHISSINKFYTLRTHVRVITLTLLIIPDLLFEAIFLCHTKQLSHFIV